jgi:hypothetical protein
MPPLSVFQLPIRVETGGFGEQAERQMRTSIGMEALKIVGPLLVITIN